MVKIIAGEIVSDDDIRAQRFDQRQRNNQPFPNVWQRGGGGQSNQYQQQQSPPAGEGAPGPLTEINNRLRGFGIGNQFIQGRLIEPVFQVAAVLALVFYGIPGIIVVGLIWFFTSQN